MAVEVGQRSRGGGGGGGDLLGGGRAAQGHGEEILVLFFFIGQSTQYPPPISLPSPTQLALSVVDVRCQHSSSSFLSLSLFVAASKSHVTLLVESIHSTSSDEFPASVHRYRSAFSPRTEQLLLRSIARLFEEEGAPTPSSSGRRLMRASRSKRRRRRLPPPHVVGLQLSSSSPSKSTATDVNRGRR